MRWHGDSDNNNDELENSKTLPQSRVTNELPVYTASNLNNTTSIYNDFASACYRRSLQQKFLSSLSSRHGFAKSSTLGICGFLTWNIVFTPPELEDGRSIFSFCHRPDWSVNQHLDFLLRLRSCSKRLIMCP